MQRHLNKEKFYADATLKEVERRTEEYKTLLHNVSYKVSSVAEIGRTIKSIITEQLDDIARSVSELELLTMVPIDCRERNA